MELTRHWRARHNGQDIEVQWTGMQFPDGWTLRLLINGKEQARTQPVSSRPASLAAGSGANAVKVDFRQRPFRNHCTISTPAGKILMHESQPWNALAMAVVLSPVFILFAIVIRGLLGRA